MNSLELFRSNTSLKEIRRLFFKKNIKSINSDDRIIFYPKDRSSRTKYDDPIVRECNGLVIDIEEKKVLAVPPQLLLHTFSYKVINDYISRDLFTIYKTRDGTRITLYYFRNLWRFSSSRGYDVTNLKWNGPSTYKEIFDSILLELGVDVDEFYDSLDKSHCYNLGFNHTDYHPFSTKNLIWFINSVNTSTMEIYDDCPCSGKILSQEIVPHTDGNSIINASDLRIECEASLKNYFNERENPLFGYILRSNNCDVTGKYSNLIIESSLLWKIRRLHYNNIYKTHSHENNYNRVNYTVLYNYLKNKDTFASLFPRYTKVISKLDTFFDKLLKDLIRYYQIKNSSGHKSPNRSSYDDEPSYDDLIICLYSGINKTININVDDNDHEEYIKQYILSADNADLYYTFIWPK